MKCRGEDFFGRREDMYRTIVIAVGFEELEDLQAVVSRQWCDTILEKNRTSEHELVLKNLRDLLQDG